VIHPLAFGSVDALEQRGDETFLNGEFGLQRGDFRSEFLDLLFRRLDGPLTSN
jgi:hypothetical protein